MFILVGFDSSLQEDLYRISWCLKNKIFPYVMRHQKCWTSENKDFYTDIAAWTNQNKIIKNYNFEKFLEGRVKIGSINEKRKEKDLSIYNLHK